MNIPHFFFFFCLNVCYSVHQSPSETGLFLEKNILPVQKIPFQKGGKNDFHVAISL